MTTTGQERAAARMEARALVLAERHAGQEDASTRQRRRAHFRFMVAQEEKGRKKALRLAARPALGKRKKRQPEPAPLRGLGWVGHLHSMARQFAMLRGAKL